MADSKQADLAPGFDEVPLNEGFEEVPLNQPQIASQSLMDKLKGYGQSAIDTGKQALQTGVESLADTGRGGVQGLSMGLSDEAIAATKATEDEKVGTPEWAKSFRKYQQLEQAKNDAAKARSPILYKGAELAGIIAPALMTAGASVPEQAEMAALKTGAKLTAEQLAKKAAVGLGTGAVMGGVMGASTSEKGALIGATPEEQEKLKADTIGGAITGGVTGGILSPAVPLVGAGIKSAKGAVNSKLENYIADSPFWKQVVKAKDLGEEGVDIYSREAKYGQPNKLQPGEAGPQVRPGLISADTNATEDLMNRIYNVDQQLGQKVGESIDNATNQGVKIDLTDPMLNSVNTFKNLMEKDQTLAANPKAKKLYDTIFQMAGDDGQFDASNLTPKEVQSLRSDVSDFADSIKLKNPDIASLGYQFQGQLGDLLKTTLPDYKIASQRFESFRRLVPETIISGSTPVDISGIKLGNLKNDEAKLFSSVKGMIQGSETPGFGTSKEQETFKNFISGLDQFGKDEAQRVNQGLIKDTDVPKLIDTTDQSQAKAIENLVRDKADTSALLQQAWRVNPQESAATAIKGSMFGRGSAMNFANKYGLYKDTLTKPVAAPVVLTKKIYNASEDELRGMATKMSQIPGLQSVGKTLTQGLDNKDIAGVNAAIFSIMQNPQARILLNAEDLDSDKKGQ